MQQRLNKFNIVIEFVILFLQKLGIVSRKVTTLFIGTTNKTKNCTNYDTLSTMRLKGKLMCKFFTRNAVAGNITLLYRNIVVYIYINI